MEHMQGSHTTKEQILSQLQFASGDQYPFTMPNNSRFTSLYGSRFQNNHLNHPDAQQLSNRQILRPEFVIMERGLYDEHEPHPKAVNSIPRP